MKKYILCITALLLCAATFSQDKKPVKVLLLGTFHFDNPGLDVAKFKSADILSPKRQKEILEVVNQLKAFAPDKIFIESIPERQSKTDSAVEQYKSGNLQLDAGEIDQLALRLAKDLGLHTIYGVDYRDADFPFDSLMKSAAEAGQVDFIADAQKTFDSVENAFNESLQKSTVKELLLHQNTVQDRNLQVGLYFKFLAVGKSGNHVGAYLTSEWWRRNMIIYENILKRLSGNEKKILVIFGSGHTAILNEMMRYNPAFELVPVAKILK